MPTYEYSCAKCGASFDHFQSIKAKPLTTCPKEACPRKRWGKGRIKRQIGLGAGIIFKGGGFYETDYRSANYKEGEKKASEAAKKATDKKDAKKSDTKKTAKPKKAAKKK